MRVPEVENLRRLCLGVSSVESVLSGKWRSSGRIERLLSNKDRTKEASIELRKSTCLSLVQYKCLLLDSSTFFSFTSIYVAGRESWFRPVDQLVRLFFAFRIFRAFYMIIFTMVLRCGVYISFSNISPTITSIIYFVLINNVEILS